MWISFGVVGGMTVEVLCEGEDFWLNFRVGFEYVFGVYWLKEH